MADQGTIGLGGNRLLRAIERIAALDSVADVISSAVQKATTSDTVKNALSGAFLGHALHPALTDLPIGFWNSAVLLDLVGGRDADTAVDVLLLAGNVSALGAAVTGLADWSDADAMSKRAGLVHAGLNAGALTLFTGALASRRAGARASGTSLSLLGAAVATASAYIGGHLVYRRGLAVDHSGFELDEAVPEWEDAAADGDVAEGKAVAVEVKGVRVMLTRDAGEVRALLATCNHAGGPLPEGEIAGGAVTCPWHGSRFSLRDGSVRRGPAALPQPTLEARVRNGRIEVRTA